MLKETIIRTINLRIACGDLGYHWKGVRTGLRGKDFKSVRKAEKDAKRFTDECKLRLKLHKRR